MEDEPKTQSADAGAGVRNSSEVDFEEFYAAYRPPPNAKKPRTREIWNLTANSRPSQTDLLRAVASYNAWLDEQSRKQKREYPKQHPDTWLCGKVWEGFIGQNDKPNTASLREMRERAAKIGLPTDKIDRAIIESEAADRQDCGG